MPTDFKKAFERELKHIGRRRGLNSDKAFLYWFARNVLEIDEMSALEAVNVDGANDKGIDLFYVDDDNERIIIVQGKYSPGLDYKPKEKDVDRLLGCLHWLVNPEALRREGRKELAEAADDFVEAQKNGYGTELIYVYTGKKSANIEKKIAVYNLNDENVQKSRVLRHYHLDLITDLWEEIQGGIRRIRSEEIETKGGRSNLDGQFGSALLTSVPCSELVRLYKAYGDKLFDRNVRLYLGAHKGSVNAGMAATIKDPNDRLNFWAYNNGITVICDDFEEVNTAVKLTNFSVINGCQTTVSLAENEGTDPNMYVAVRFIAAAAELVDDIIRCTNSQNPMRTWDIASQRKTQRRLKGDFAELKKPYLYITRRGDKPKANIDKYKDDGRLRKIQIDVLGQYMAAYRGDPVLAYKHKAFIFSKHHDEVFPPDIRVEDVLFVWLCGEVCKEIVLEKIKGIAEDAKILKKGGTLFTLAVMSEILKLRNGATFLTGLSEDQITSQRAKDRMEKYSKYSAALYLAGVRDEQEIQSVELNTLIRQKEFIDKVLARIKRQYDKDALNSEWIKGALPKL